MVQHDFKVKFHWYGGRNETGTFQGDILQESFSIPSSLEGVGQGTNPDELLVSAAGSCFTISLAATLERAHFEINDIHLTSVGTAEFAQNIFTMKQITHDICITVKNNAIKEKLERRINHLLKIADTHCMVSNSLRGNVKIRSQAKIVI